MIQDITHRYASYGSNHHDSTCRIRIFERAGAQPPVVLVTELPTNEGASVTNLSESIAADVLRTYLASRAQCEVPFIWIEHYPASQLFGERFTRVTFSHHRPEQHMLFSQKMQWQIGNPSWHSITREEVERLTGTAWAPERVTDNQYATT
jgi:hypothetical protein